MALLGAFLAGCAGLTLSYDGTLSRADNRMPLEAAGAAPSVWRTNDIAIHFTAVRTADDVAIDGRLELLNSVKNFSGIDDLRVNIHFINAAGIIIDSRLLWSAGVGADPTLVRWSFSQRFRLPSGTTALGFSYRGAFSESGDETGGQADWEVWQKP